MDPLLLLSDDEPSDDFPDVWDDRRRRPATVWTWKALAILTGITLLAGILRLYRLGEWSFWIDEVHTLRDSVLMPAGEFWYHGTSQYPLSFLLLRWISDALPGTEEGSSRLLFAYFGIASVPLIAIVVRSMFGTGAGLIAALVLCLSPWHIFWSQNCRFYSLVLFLSLATMGAFYLGTETGRRSWLVVSVITAGLAIFSHPSSLFQVPALCLYPVLLKWGLAPWPRRLTLRTLAWFIVPVLGFFLLMLMVGGGGFWRAFEDFRRAKGSSSFFHLVNTTVFYVQVPILVVGIAGAWLLFMRRDRAGVLLALLLVVPLLEIALVSLFVKATAQYLLFSLPAWYALAAFALREVGRDVSRDRRNVPFLRYLLLGVLVLDLAAQDHLYFHYRYGDRPRWREAADYVDRNKRAGDIIASTNVPSMEWYLNPARPRLNERMRGSKIVEPLTPWDLPNLEDFVARAEDHKSRVWVVLTNPEFQEMDPGKRWEAWLQSRFHLVRRLTNWHGPRDMTVFIYRYGPPSD
ncbi:MAG: glycosyltransferase family 39 protein [Planctomycetota bacterium]